MSQTVKNLLAKRETQIQSLSQEDPLEKGMTTHSLSTPFFCSTLPIAISNNQFMLSTFLPQNFLANAASSLGTFSLLFSPLLQTNSLTKCFTSTYHGTLFLQFRFSSLPSDSKTSDVCFMFLLQKNPVTSNNFYIYWV